MMKNVTLCADDYGLSETISRGIIDLAEKSRLSAISCVTTHPRWLKHAPWLSNHHNRLDIGLHINLTEGSPLGSMQTLAPNANFPSMPTVLFKAFCRRLSSSEIADEIERQLDRFISGTGHIPDFIDGHEHVHHLPVVREALLTVYEKHLRSRPVYLRAATNGLHSFLKLSSGFIKANIITLTGAHSFKKSLAKRRIPHNNSFTGIYSFSKAKNYSQLFPEFLKNIEDGGLILCHPGHESDDENDRLKMSRAYEYQYFMSEQFVEDCKLAKVKIGRFKH